MFVLEYDTSTYDGSVAEFTQKNKWPLQLKRGEMFICPGALVS